MPANVLRTLRFSHDAYVVTCSGDEPAVETYLRDGLSTTERCGAVYVIVDVAETRTLGAASVVLLLDASHALRERGGDLWLVALDPRLLRELDAEGSARRMHVEPALADAVAAMSARSAASASAG